MTEDLKGLDSRRRLFTEIFGVDRPISRLEVQGSSDHVPDRIEQIQSLHDAILTDIEEDVLPPEAEHYILSQNTEVRSVSDTQSLSSNEDRLSADSPRKIIPNSSPKRKTGQSSARPLPPPISTSFSCAANSTHVPSPQRSQSDLPRLKSSFSQLSMSGHLKKQQTNLSSTPTTLKKSPCKGSASFPDQGQRIILITHNTLQTTDSRLIA